MLTNLDVNLKKRKKKELQANAFDEHRRKIPQQSPSKLNPTIHLKKSFTKIKWNLLPGYKGSIFAHQST